MPTRKTGDRDDLSKGLAAARKSAGLSQYEAADRAGTYQSKIARVESGRTLPDEEFVSQLCAAYKTSATERRRLVELAQGHQDTQPARSAAPQPGRVSSNRSAASRDSPH